MGWLIFLMTRGLAPLEPQSLTFVDTLPKNRSSAAGALRPFRIATPNPIAKETGTAANRTLAAVELEAGRALLRVRSTTLGGVAALPRRRANHPDEGLAEFCDDDLVQKAIERAADVLDGLRHLESGA